MFILLRHAQALDKRSWERPDVERPLSRIGESQARALVEQNHVFAVIPVASPIFPGGKYLQDHSIPTFGWHINPEWSPGPTMFGQDGSFINFTGVNTFYGYLGKQINAKKVAIFAYNVSQSRDCATGAEKAFKQYGFDVAFDDSSLAFGTTSLDADVQRVKDANVDMVATCMDVTGNTLLSKTLRRAGLGNVKQFWPTGYDAQALALAQSLTPTAVKDRVIRLTLGL